MIFEFSHVVIDLPDEMNWCETRSWTLPEMKAMFSASQYTTIQTKGWVPVFLENHDQPRSISHFLPEDADRIAGAKALATLLLTMRGTPFIMQGEELGFVNVSWPDIGNYNDVSTNNHYQFAIGEGYSADEALAGVHRFARDSARTPMQWNTSKNAGFTTGTPWLPTYEDYLEFNAASERADRESVLNWYIKLADLRKNYAGLTEGSYEEMFHENGQIFAYKRETEEASAYILINFSTAEAFFDAACLGDAKLILGSNGTNKKGTLLPMEAVIYELKR